MWQKILAFFSKSKKKTEQETYSSLRHVYTPVQSLLVGMYVTELDIPWLDSPFMFRGFTIETENDMKLLRDTCQYVYIDQTKQAKAKGVKLSPELEEKRLLTFGKPPERLGSFEKEVGRAEKTYKETGVIVSGFMYKIADGGGIDTKLAKEAVQACVNSVLHSPDAFLWLSQLKDKDEYTSQHSLNVCVLSIV